MARMSPIDVQKALKGAHYPAKGKELAKVAEDNGADRDLIRELQAHSKETYDGPNDVQKVFGKG
jgi:Protein of unknown function (DUF2795)